MTVQLRSINHHLAGKHLKTLATPAVLRYALPMLPPIGDKHKVHLSDHTFALYLKVY